MKFKVRVTTVTTGEFEIEASNLEEAKKKIRENDYSDEIINVTSSDEASYDTTLEIVE